MVLETLKKLFTPVENFDADQLRAYLAEHKEGTFTLLDVRQPGEYKEAHIPGAKLIPIAQLPDRMKELDPEKPVIAY
jgi:sulfur-carrier protein adenylyltransferase/sulfurtransferase